MFGEYNNKQSAMSYCETPERRNYYSTHDRYFLSRALKASDSTTNSSEFCTPPTYSDELKVLCPSGWKFVGTGTSGCRTNKVHAICEKTAWKSDTASKARCCLSDKNDPDCEPGFCIAKQQENKCKQALESHCRTQFGTGKPDNSACWRWAKEHWPLGIDEYCRRIGDSGIGIENDSQCREYANDKQSHGKLDNTMGDYCNSELGRNKKVCSCFAKSVDLSDTAKKLTELGAPVACWSETCLTDGYKLKDQTSRMKNCGSFCAQVLEIEDIDVDGDFVAQAICDGQTNDRSRQAAEQVDKNVTELNDPIVIADGELGQTGINTTTIVIVAVASLLALFAIFGVVLTLLYEDEPQDQMFVPVNNFPPQFAPAQSVRNVAPETISSQLQKLSPTGEPFSVAQPQVITVR